MSVALAIPAPSTLVDVYGLCRSIQEQMVEITDIGMLKEAAAKLSAIDEYLARTSTEGRKELQETMRRLEVRCGELLGEGRRGNPGPNGGAIPIPPSDRRDFRDMAAHPDVVDEVIAESTDEDPPSRRKILGRIRDRKREQETPEQEREREDREHVQRMARMLIEFNNSWRAFRAFTTHPKRAEILAALPTDRDRELVAEAEEEIRWAS